MPNIYFKWSLVEFFNFDVFLSLKVILILINSTDPDELPHFRSSQSLFAFRIQILPYMSVCILYSEAYLRKHPKADKKLIETQITATLKQALLQKAIKIKCMRTKKAILSSSMQFHEMSLRTIWTISFPFG